MRQIRARIREKRGADYTEAELQQLASVKLERFLDPQRRALRSAGAVPEAPRRVEPPTPQLRVRGHDALRIERGRCACDPQAAAPDPEAVLQPDADHRRAAHPVEAERQPTTRRARSTAHYEIIHNLVVEITRLGIEVQNLKMRVESLSSRLDFDERRARSLEGVVQYRPRRRPVAPPAAAPRLARRGPSRARSARPCRPHATRRASRRRRRAAAARAGGAAPATRRARRPSARLRRRRHAGARPDSPDARRTARHGRANRRRTGRRRRA